MQATETNPNDEIRRTILQYFYDRNVNATSRFGKKGSAVKISDVKRELKSLHGLTQQEVMSNLTYLIDRGWVKTVDQEKTVATKGGTTVPSVVTFYEVSALGIEKSVARARTGGCSAPSPSRKTGPSARIPRWLLCRHGSVSAGRSGPCGDRGRRP